MSRNIQWEKNISIRTSEENDYLGMGFPFIRVCNSDWTVILRSIGCLGNEVYEVPKEAQALSARLETKAIILMEEDTSGAIAYELSDNSELVEKYEYAGGEEDFYFESKLREKPNINFDWEPDEKEYYDTDYKYDVSAEPKNQFVDAFFRELGIYLPACYPVSENEKPALAVVEASEKTIERADLLFIEEKLEDDRKEPDPDDAE